MKTNLIPVLAFSTIMNTAYGQITWEDFESKEATLKKGVKLHYKVAGEGVPVLLMHGWLGTHYTWRKLAPMLVNEGYKVIVPDMKGYGDSDKPEDGYDGLTLVEEMRELLKQVGIAQKIHVVGWDMGALPAYLFAATYPNEVASMTYLDEPLPSVNIHKLSAFTKENFGGYWHFGFNHAQGLPELLIRGNEREFFKYLHGLMLVNKSAITETDLDEYMRTYRGTQGIKGSNGWYRDLFVTTEQFASAIKNGKLKVPVLAVGGQYGTPYTKQQMEGVIADNIEGGVIPNCGHLIAEERPAELFAYLKDFYEKLEY